MTILNKHEIATPSLVEYLQLIEQKQAEGWVIGYDGHDTPFQTGNLLVATMCLHGEEASEPVAEKAPIVAPKATPAKPIAKKGA